MKVIRHIFILLFTFYILKFRKYYLSPDELPVINYFKIRRGHLGYLYKRRFKRKVPVHAFIEILKQIIYQFKHLNNDYARAKADLAVYKSNFARTGLSRWKNEIYIQQIKIDNWSTDELDLDEFTQYIELNLNSPIGSFDINISTSRAFLAFEKAKEVHKKSVSSKNNKTLV